MTPATVSPLAGKPVTKEMLVDLAQLEREYYERRPDVSDPNQMVSFGRAPDNDVVVGDPATSGHHGRIEVRNGFFWISDLGSTNGTLVNGEPVIEKQLADGDMVAIGQNTMRFTLEA